MKKLKNWYNENKEEIYGWSAFIGVTGTLVGLAITDQRKANRAADRARTDLIESIENHFNTTD